MTRALYAGTFDPLTFGHLDLIERGARLFDELVVAVGDNSRKRPLFDADERVHMLRRHTASLGAKAWIVACGRSLESRTAEAPPRSTPSSPPR